MKTIVLPGYSVHNKEWAEEVARNLGSKAQVHYWRHWTEGGSLSLKYEVERIIEEIGKEKVDIIAKSVGTMISMEVLFKVPDFIQKIILCGIPTVSRERLELFRKALRHFPVLNIIIFQNSKDPFASFEEVKNFMKSVNPKIKVIEKPRSDHNYPYVKDFKDFLS